MADPKDLEASKAVRRLFTRRGVDTTLADIRCSHGVVTVRGVVAAIRGMDVEDLRSTVEHLCRALRTRPEIREIVIDVTYRT